MYLHTRLLLGILGVTLFALLVSVLVPLGSLRQDVSRETDASMQLASLLLDIEASIRGSENGGEARAAAARELRRAEHLRHVSLALLDEQGAAIATTPNDTPAGGWLARLLLPYGTRAHAGVPALLPRRGARGAAGAFQPHVRIRGARRPGEQRYRAAGRRHRRHGDQHLLDGAPRTAAGGRRSRRR